MLLLAYNETCNNFVFFNYFVLQQCADSISWEKKKKRHQGCKELRIRSSHDLMFSSSLNLDSKNTTVTCVISNVNTFLINLMKFPLTKNKGHLQILQFPAGLL